jgi:hypothetical protein
MGTVRPLIVWQGPGCCQLIFWVIGFLFLISLCGVLGR